MEVYLDNVNDLLSPGNTSKKAKLFAFNPFKYILTNTSQIHKLMHTLHKNRKTSDNTFNKSSSRSHCFIKVSLEVQGNTRCLTLVDLAGSEKWSDNKSKNAVQEANAINTSLTALTSVIQALPSRSFEQCARVPYKNSLLTTLLEDSLHPGSSVTVMIAVRP